MSRGGVRERGLGGAAWPSLRLLHPTRRFRGHTCPPRPPRPSCAARPRTGAAFTSAAPALVPLVPQLELKSPLSGPDARAQKLTHLKWTVQGSFSNIVVPPPEPRYGTFYHPKAPPEPCRRGSPGAPGRPARTSVLRRRLSMSSLEAHRAALGAWLLVLITEPWRHLSVTARWATEAATTRERRSSAHQPSEDRFPGRLRPLPGGAGAGPCGDLLSLLPEEAPGSGVWAHRAAWASLREKLLGSPGGPARGVSASRCGSGHGLGLQRLSPTSGSMQGTGSG